MSIYDRNGRKVLAVVSKTSRSEFRVTCSTCNGEFENFSTFVAHEKHTHSVKKGNENDTDNSKKMVQPQSSGTSNNKVSDAVNKLNVRSNSIRKKTQESGSSQESIAKKPFSVCQYCKHIFATFPEANEHHKNCKEKKKRRVNCRYCSDQFESERGMSKHLWYAHKDRLPYRCTICPTTFKTEAELQGHLLKTHIDNEAIECDYCEEMIYSKFQETFHMKKVHPEIKIK